ncbi:MAG: universal stress protein [Hyphomicrobiales bacterium]
MFRTILVPIDLAEPEMAGSALAHAVAMAKQADGSLILVNVVPMMPTGAVDFIPVDLQDDMASKAKTALEAKAKSVDLPAGRVSTEIRVGGVYHEVLDVAEKRGVDLVVVGSHRPAMSTYLLGSNATAIVRHATCSVLVIRQ